MAAVPAQTRLRKQYSLNKKLAKHLGVHTRASYPKLKDITSEALPHMGSTDALLIIAPTVKRVPLVSATNRHRSIISSFRQLADPDGNWRFGIRQWGGFLFNKAEAENPVHDRRVKGLFHVAVVPTGLETQDSSLLFTEQTTAQQIAKIDALNVEAAYTGEVSPMTCSQYLTLSALRVMMGKARLDTGMRYTRFPHYLSEGDGVYPPRVSAASGGVDSINLQEFDANLAIEAAGVRVVIDVNQN